MLFWASLMSTITIKYIDSGLKRKSLEKRSRLEFDLRSGYSFKALFTRSIYKLVSLTSWLTAGLVQKNVTFLDVGRTTLNLKFDQSVKLSVANLVVLHLSDLHLDLGGFDFEQLLRDISEQYFHFAVITGDFIDRDSDILSTKYKQLSDTIVKTQKMKVPILAVLGNHDSYKDIAIIESLNTKILVNESCVLSKNGEEFLLITGVDDTSFFACAESYQTAISSPLLKLALAHSPNISEYFAASDYDLMLCGHTHGGQLNIFGMSLFSLSTKYSSDLISGYWRREKMQGYTSRGIGCSLIPVRLNTSPEYVLVSFQQEWSDEL